MSQGKFIKVIDPRGGQAVDLFAFNVGDVKKYPSAHHARPSTERLFPTGREAFYAQERRRIIALVEDPSPGIHDLLFTACNPIRYRELGVEGWHASCEKSLQKDMEAIGVRGVEMPQPVNLVTNYPVFPDGRMGVAAPHTKPGDYVLLRVEGNPTDISVEVG